MSVQIRKIEIEFAQADPDGDIPRMMARVLMTLEDDRIVPGKFRFPGKPDEEWPRLYLTKICQYLTKMLQDLDPDYGNPGRKAETFLQELDMPRERILGMMDREAEHLAPFTDETEGSQGTDC